MTITFVRPPKPAALNQQPAKPEPAPATEPRTIANELTKLADLRDRKVLSSDEFEAMKTEALAHRMPVTQETLSIVEAANRLSIASTTLMSWIEKARADGPNGGVVRRKRYPDLIITWDSNELRVLPW